MSNLRFVEKLANAAWLCDPEHVEFLHGIFLRYLDRAASGERFDRQAVEQAVGRPLENTRKVTVRDGVARIPVEGTIMRRASLFTEISGGVSTEALTKDFLSAYNDATVHSILFVFDSPGGEATGINELSTLIREKRDEGLKRIEAYCDGLCASAAYWLASATSKITTDAMGALGAIGVVTRVRNPETAGKRTTLEFWNARSPKKRMNPNSYEGQEAIQAYVDDLGDQFIAVVADNRGVSEEEVVKDFGEGFVLTGLRAVAVGLADELGSEEGVIASLVARQTEPKPVRPAASLVGQASVVVTANNEREEQVTEQTTEKMPGEVAASEDVGKWAAAAPESPESILDRIKGLIGMTPTSPPAVNDRADNATDGQASEQGQETDSGMSDTQTERAERARTDEEEGREDALSTEEREELYRLRAEREAEQAEKAQLAAALRERGIRTMLDAKSVVDLGNGKRGVMPKAQRDAAETLIAALAEAGADPIELSASGEATLKDNESGRAVNALITHWKPVELGERGTREGEARKEGAEGDHERVIAELEKRELGMEHYGAVAGELAAKGEIRREA